MKSVLNFLTLVWQSQALAELFLKLRQSVSAFLSTVVRLLGKEDPGSQPYAILCDSLITAFSAIESHPVFVDLDLKQQDSLWKLALKSRRSDLLVACA